ncbi:rab-GTPase-TBC domain-containing protein [Entophlyctis helioformis]|nr:rab-GTPase-TBC domain-containing protein [Entophlyctis helioformis]
MQQSLASADAHAAPQPTATTATTAQPGSTTRAAAAAAAAPTETVLTSQAQSQASQAASVIAASAPPSAQPASAPHALSGLLLPQPSLSSTTTSPSAQHASVWKTKLAAVPGRVKIVYRAPIATLSAAPSATGLSPLPVPSPSASPSAAAANVSTHPSDSPASDRKGLGTGIVGCVGYKRTSHFTSSRQAVAALSEVIASDAPQDTHQRQPTNSTKTEQQAVAPESAQAEGTENEPADPTNEATSTDPSPGQDTFNDEESMEILTGKASAMSRRSTDTARPKEPATPSTPNEEAKMMADIARLNTLSIRFTKFKTILDQPNIDLEQLRKLSWPGIPEEIRATVWKLLMGYLPANSDRREATLQRKRKEYEEYVQQAFSRGTEELDQALYHQIHIDIQRTNAGMQLYQNATTRESLERVLYVWAIRHPASGYVQGINDLVTPFFQVYLQEVTTGDVEMTDPSTLEKETLMNVEADSFWCLAKLLDGIQDNYTHKQPGIHRQIGRLKELINRIDAPLHNHLGAQGIEFLQFAFRWVNCMLMREVSLRNTIRMWDTYLAEGSDGFSEFHLYVCAAFLVKWSPQIKKMEFQDIMMHLQSPPTSGWAEKDIELLLSEAFMWKSLFHNSPNHLNANGSSSPSLQ